MYEFVMPKNLFLHFYGHFLQLYELLISLTEKSLYFCILFYLISIRLFQLDPQFKLNFSPLNYSLVRIHDPI